MWYNTKNLERKESFHTLRNVNPIYQFTMSKFSSGFMWEIPQAKPHDTAQILHYLCNTKDTGHWS